MDAEEECACSDLDEAPAVVVAAVAPAPVLLGSADDESWLVAMMMALGGQAHRHWDPVARAFSD